MLIGLLSDTHIGYPGEILPAHIQGASRGVTLETLPPEVYKAFKGVDLILHAGDIYKPSVLDELESFAPVKAAWGDDDDALDFGNDKRLLKRQILDVDGVSIWVSHVKPVFMLINPEENWYYLDIGLGDVEDPGLMPTPPDVVVYGHTHFANLEHLRDVEHDKNVIAINPGSATFPNYVAKLGSVGLLSIENGKVDAKIVPLNGDLSII